MSNNQRTINSVSKPPDRERDHPALQEEPVWNDRETVSLGEIAIKIVSKKGLVIMKNVAGRPQDIADIDALRRLDGES
ncbi:MAG: nucleotidyltransferase [Pirellula sp.]|nr:nucleotidyltransferase [Pirellula sp.]